MSHHTITISLKVIAELLVVFAGAIGVVSMIQDYYWFSSPELITDDKVTLKYFAGILAVLFHGVFMLRNRKINRK